MSVRDFLTIVVAPARNYPAELVDELARHFESNDLGTARKLKEALEISFDEEEFFPQEMCDDGMKNALLELVTEHLGKL